jgi:hypothetical protein
MKENYRPRDGPPQSLTAIKPAAIWARVSTHNQSETSLPSQVERCKARLERDGYSLIHTFQLDWTSTDLFACPQFQELRRLIINREIEALAVFDRDRLEAKGLQRLVFISDCKAAGVKLVICHGPPILDEPEGQLVELALAIGKERAVLRARQGSKDGLYDRAVKYRKPVTYHKLYGYQWDKPSNRLVPDDNYLTVKLIFNMLLAGSSYHPIIQELKRRGILSPSGQPEWNKATLSSIIHNPCYAGRYFALKKQAVEPHNRRGSSYGNSSVRKLPLEEAHYIPEIEIVDPPITWEQRGRILEQLAKHQKLAQRNARMDYLLRGMIFCETHRGKNGEPRRYHGQPHYGTWRYVCPVGGCTHPFFNGPHIEREAQAYIKLILLCTPDELYDLIRNKKNQEQTEQQLRRELHSLEVKYDRTINAEAKLEDSFFLGKVDPEVHDRLKTKYKNERQWIKDKQLAIQHELAQLGREAEAVESINKMRSRYINGLDKMHQSEWRGLFVQLNLEIHVRTKEDQLGWESDRSTNLNRDGDKSALCKTGFADYWFQLGIPLKQSQREDVVSINPERD